MRGMSQALPSQRHRVLTVLGALPCLHISPVHIPVPLKPVETESREFFDDFTTVHGSWPSSFAGFFSLTLYV